MMRMFRKISFILLLLASAQLLANECESNIDANFSNDGLSVTAISDKGLSNVVLQFADGSEQKFEIGRDDQYSLDFSGTGGNAGKTLTGVWIKSGCEQSGDGPGYGEFIQACNENYTVQISPSEQTVLEGEESDFTISLTESVVSQGCLAAVRITTIDGTATGGEDYSTIDTEHTFADSDVTFDLAVPTLKNLSLELDKEIFTVRVEPIEGSFVTNNAEGQVTIAKVPSPE